MGYLHEIKIRTIYCNYLKNTKICVELSPTLDLKKRIPLF